MMKDCARKELLELFRERALQRGRFVLASGRQSDYYVDAKLVSFHPRGAYLSARWILELVRGEQVDAVGGMALGAVPIACAVAALSCGEGRLLPAFAVRKESKGHGTQKRIEGYLRPGWRVVLLEDVISTGRSTLQAVAQVEAAGARVFKVLALLDRLMGGKETLAEAGYPLESLFTCLDLGING